jgi:hypothetical protein
LPDNFLPRRKDFATTWFACRDIYCCGYFSTRSEFDEFTIVFLKEFRHSRVHRVEQLFVVLTSSAQHAAGAKIFGQALVESAHGRHPEATEIAISARSSHGCETIASTDRGDIGEKCEKDEVTPMRTGNPFVEKKKDGFDVSLPLHDAQGRVVGAVGIEFKLEPGQTESGVLAQEGDCC